MSYEPSLYKSPAGQRAVMELYDQALAEWPVPYDSHEIDTRHGRTFLIACGPTEAPPLLLLHGAGTNLAVWITDVATYCQGFKVYAADLIGEAGRSTPNRPPWDGPAYGEWLADIIDNLGLRRVSLAGVSLGGWTCIKYAVARPELVERLVLISPGGIVPNRLSFALKAIPLSMAGNWGLRRIVNMLYGNQPVPEEAVEVTKVVTRYFKPRIGTLPVFGDDELATLTMPVLLLGGSQDVLLDMPETAARLERILPQLTVSIRPGVGHAMLNTAAEVMDFLRQYEPVAASA